ncbi:aldehyde dehydrogenase family protein [Kribbella sp. NPDC051137]|uniref:aldehyde dehydrogenase family protein n=1 Tax=Kribbella sp. NPDC051137 TaxID=3155045 RepID=UPI00344185A4
MTKAEVAGVVVSHLDKIFLGGSWVGGQGGRQAILSPSTGRPIAEVSLPSATQATAAVGTAHEHGLRYWARTSVADRVAFVRRMCELLEARLPELGRLWAAEAGMAVRYSRTLHKFGAAGAWSASLAVAEEALADQWHKGPMGDVLVRREPVGVVVGVMAYNGPLVTLATKIIPALLAGCPVVVKAAPESQLVLRIVAECAEEAALPPGTLSILCGDAELGRVMTADERVDLVSLTGGQRAAQDIISATAPRFARTHLELGGKSAALILPDADLDHALRSLTPGATSGTGQVCALLTRILVPQSRYDETVEALRAAWSRLIVGDPLDPETHLGPLANAAAYDRTERFLAQAIDEGGEVLVGGRRPPGLDAGWYFEPTIVGNVRRDSYLARNEVFGPITAVMTYDDLDDGIALANDTTYGLAASVYTRDRAAGLECASRIVTGSVGVNAFGPDVTAPWGGRKGSGWGREGGAEGIHEFTELKQIVLGPGLDDQGAAR